jgi:two-component system, sensor histidine kinase PdtaS
MQDSLELRYRHALAEAEEQKRRHAELQKQYHEILQRGRAVGRDLMLVFADFAQHRLKSPVHRAKVERLAAQVKIVARAYERLDPAPHLAAEDFLKDVCHDIVAAETRSAIRFNFRAAPVMIGYRQAVPLGLVASELIFNAYDHGLRQDGMLSVDVGPGLRGMGRLTVHDSGNGGLTMPFAKGAGLIIAETLLESMNGALLFRPGPGCEIAVHFPLWRPRPRQSRDAAEASLAPRDTKMPAEL